MVYFWQKYSSQWLHTLGNKLRTIYHGNSEKMLEQKSSLVIFLWQKMAKSTIFDKIFLTKYAFFDRWKMAFLAPKSFGAYTLALAQLLHHFLIPISWHFRDYQVLLVISHVNVKNLEKERWNKHVTVYLVTRNIFIIITQADYHN